MKRLRSGAYLNAMLFGLSIAVSASSAVALTFTPGETPKGLRFISVGGEFLYGENLAEFTQLVNQIHATVVTFNSPGGSPVTAMELGRLIRILNLATYQPRTLECSSACALAFFGGTTRVSDPGAIGVHKSSFANPSSMNIEDAVSQVQYLTGLTISYMTEMGVDPALLQLSLQYEKDDIRYLSGSEMTSYHVTTPWPTDDQTVTTQNVPVPQAAPAQTPNYPPSSTSALGSTTPQLSAQFAIPLAKTGKVRHPEGSEFLRSEPTQAAAKIGKVDNGDPVSILNVYDRWYYVNVKGRTGYLHHNWVKVDQFISMPFNNRYIQIASFDNFPETQAYIQQSSMRLTAYYATNHWFAVTLTGTYPAKRAAEALKVMKSNGSIPDDAFMTVGNTYVGKACCE